MLTTFKKFLAIPILELFDEYRNDIGDLKDSRTHKVSSEEWLSETIISTLFIYLNFLHEIFIEFKQLIKYLDLLNVGMQIDSFIILAIPLLYTNKLRNDNVRV